MRTDDPKLTLALLEAKAAFASLPPFYAPSFQGQALEPTGRIMLAFPFLGIFSG